MPLTIKHSLTALIEQLQGYDPGHLPCTTIQDGFRQSLPGRSGIYFIVDTVDDSIQYIGKAANIRSRWGSSYMAEPHRWQNYCFDNAPRYQLRCWLMRQVFTTPIEALLIAAVHPPWNSHGNTGYSDMPLRPEDNLAIDTSIVANLKF